MSLDRSVAFVGPLPPPIHGLAVINQAMCREIRRYASVQVFNRAPRVNPADIRESPARAALRTPGLLLKFVSFLIVRRPCSIYLACSGGLGILQDLPFAALGILVRTRVYIHHHSFAYLDRPSWYSRIALRFLRRATHIVLCERMKGLLIKRYAVAESRVVTLSNAAFLDDWSKLVQTVPTTDYVIGFLSNITEEKGIFAYLRLAQRLQDSGAPVVTLIGGPIAKDIAGRFWGAFKTLRNAQYLGPLYGDDKAAFFSRLDLFVFPSTYHNEAEPVVVLEAMRAGVPTLATGRGCISQLLSGQGGTISPDHAVFDDFAFEWISARLRINPESRAEARRGSLACFASHRETALVALSSLVTGIVGKR